MTLRQTQMKHEEAGFTLVELAIVLVIIGLIVGGVLVGQDLIKAAEIRSVVTDLEKYNAAANTFRTKYSGVPGDFIAARANQNGLTFSAVGTNGDGDGILENLEGAGAVVTGVGGESTLFWVQLSEAGLIQNGFATATGAAEASALTATTIMNYLPSTRLRGTTYIHAHGNAGRNFYYLSDISGVAATTGAISTDTGNGFTNHEASDIDTKIDDGRPTTGSVQAMTNSTTIDPGAAAAALTTCALQGAAAAIAGDETYVLNVAGDDAVQNALNCSLRVRASF